MALRRRPLLHSRRRHQLLPLRVPCPPPQRHLRRQCFHRHPRPPPPPSCRLSRRPSTSTCWTAAVCPAQPVPPASPPAAATPGGLRCRPHPAPPPPPRTGALSASCDCWKWAAESWCTASWCCPHRSRWGCGPWRCRRAAEHRAATNWRSFCAHFPTALPTLWLSPSGGPVASRLWVLEEGGGWG